MLEWAKAETSDPAIVYRPANLEHLTLPEAAFDLAYSSLTLHYLPDLNPLFATVHRAVVPGSRFVFSIEHPIYMASRHPGWTTDAEGRRSWRVDSCQLEGERRTNWLAEGVVKYHHPLGTTLNLLIRNGFAIRHVEEWGPTDQEVAAMPALVEERDRPMMLLVAADR
jgi:SAM-dependent methyltransferase